MLMIGAKPQQVGIVFGSGLLISTYFYLGGFGVFQPAGKENQMFTRVLWRIVLGVSNPPRHLPKLYVSGSCFKHWKSKHMDVMFNHMSYP